MTHDQAKVANCSAINELGKQYCEDGCYLKGKTCDSCLGQSGCIWLGEMEFTSNGSVPPMKQMCAEGNGAGPFEY